MNKNIKKIRRYDKYVNTAFKKKKSRIVIVMSTCEFCCQLSNASILISEESDMHFYIGKQFMKNRFAYETL